MKHGGYDEPILGRQIEVGFVVSHLQGKPMAILHGTKCDEPLTAAQSGVPCPTCGTPDRDCADSDQGVAEDKAAVAKELAKKHYQIESGITQILRFIHRADVEITRAEPIKLLEVNENTVPSGVMPLYFGPAPASGIRYPSVIVEVTPEEFKKIQSHELKLPAGWDWENAEELPKPSECNGGA